ncbi:NAD(P)-dependent dehydrogenase (short-subunit alcohol dehydrogenase family) [Bradyrhizobium sp. LA2.1]
MHVLRSRGNLEKLDAAAKELGPSLLPVQVDLDDHEALCAEHKFERAYGHLDVLFVNAGIAGGTPIKDATRDSFETIIRTNLTSVFFTVQGMLGVMKASGAIVLNSSVQRQLGSPGSSAYSTSKAGVSAMTKVLASELVDMGIRVNSVVPGATRTPIWTRSARKGGSVDAAEAAFGPLARLGRLIEPEEMAAAVLYLASDAVGGVTAAEVVVDGGMTGAPVIRRK